MKPSRKSRSAAVQQSSREPIASEKLPLESLSIEPPIVGLLPAGKKRVGNQTARKAAQILVEKNQGFVIPTANQKKNLCIAFVKVNMIVYGKAFDIVRLTAPVNLDDLQDVEKQLEKIQLIEIKSTNKEGIAPDFRSYFFGLTAAEVLVAQSLKKQFKFAFVNTLTGDHIELDVVQMFAKAKGIYPTWSILF